MKKHFLYITICAEVQSEVEPSESIQEVKKQAYFLFTDTENVRFLHAEVLHIESFNPFNI